MTFGEIRRHGNRFSIGKKSWSPSMIACRDGFRFSAIAGYGAHCSPRPELMQAWMLDEDWPGPFTEVECGFWDGKRPKPAKTWRQYQEWEGGNISGLIVGQVTIYSYVPVRLVYDLIRYHGGEVPAVGMRNNTTAYMERLIRNRDRRMVQLTRMANSLGIQT